MKIRLAIMVLGLLFSGNAYADVKKNTYCANPEFLSINDYESKYDFKNHTILNQWKYIVVRQHCPSELVEVDDLKGKELLNFFVNINKYDYVDLPKKKSILDDIKSGIKNLMETDIFKSDKKKIEKCADPKAIDKGAIVMTKEVSGKNIIVFKDNFVNGNPDPLGKYKEEDLKKLSKMKLKDKLNEMSGRYEEIWDECEKEFSQTPVKFKEKYSK